MSEWTLTEGQIRAKIVELLDGMSGFRMNLWLVSGIEAGVLDAELIAKLLVREVGKRSDEVRRFWLEDECDCGGLLHD